MEDCDGQYSGHDLMSRNLQCICGFAACIKSSDDGLVNKQTGKPGSPVRGQCLLTEFPAVAVVPLCWKDNICCIHVLLNYYLLYKRSLINKLAFYYLI